MEIPPESYVDPLLIVSGSLTVVTGLAWSNAFKTLFNDYLDKKNKLHAQFIYAIVLTIIVIFFIYGLFTLSNYIETTARTEGKKIEQDFSKIRTQKLI